MKRKTYERNRRIVGQIKQERSKSTMSQMSEIHNLAMNNNKKELVKHLQGTKFRKFAEFAAERFLEAAQQIKSDKEKHNDGGNNKTSG